MIHSVLFGFPQWEWAVIVGQAISRKSSRPRSNVEAAAIELQPIFDRQLGMVRAYDPPVTTTATSTIPSPDAAVMKRLAYVRLLYQQAVTQSYNAEPLNFSAVLSFHDVCEYFFVVAFDLHRELSDNQALSLGNPFSTNLKKFRAPDGRLFSSRDTVKRIADYRDAFKHNGAIPSPDQVEQSRRDATTFLETNCLRLFGVEFADISMIHIVPQESVRNHLKAGREAANTGDLKLAMGELALAFDLLLSEWGQGKHLPGAPLTTNDFDLHYTQRGRNRRIEPGYGGSHEVRGVAQGLASSVEEALKEFDSELETIRHVMRLQIAGVDMAGYVRFSMIAPEVARSFGGPRTAIDKMGQLHYTPENYELCEAFVVESALRISQSNFNLWMPTTYGDADAAFEAMKANGGRLPDGYGEPEIAGGETVRCGFLSGRR